MLHILKRHPVPMAARFGHCLVVTWAFPEEVLRPLLPPGLAIDGLRGLGFVAAAVVQTRAMRPAWAPAALGRDFFLAGYRVFARHRAGGRTLRGLRILRSDADRWAMVLGGNLLTHYSYHKCEAAVREGEGTLEVRVRTRDGRADLDVAARLDGEAPLPDGSPFLSWREARRFAGPLPWTFDYEPQTRSIVRIKGVRERWKPRAVAIERLRSAFIEGPTFGGAAPLLASAFHTSGIDYRWERGLRGPALEEAA